MTGVVNQLISLFLMMFIGYIAARAGLITPQFRQKLSSFTLNTAAPCIIVSSVLESETVSSSMLLAVGMAAVFFVIMCLLARAIVHIVPTPKSERGLDQLMLIFTNVGFMGIPVIQSVYGPSGVALLSMFIMMFNLFFFSYGVALISGSIRFNWRSMANSCIIAALIALFFALTGLHLPDPVENTLASVGAMNTPLAMMIIGSSLAHANLRTALKNRRLYRVCFLSMAVMPLLMLVIVRFLPIDPMLAGICVILAAMPIGGNCGMISDLYTPEDLTASHAVMLSTLLSGLTLPVVCALVTAVL